MGEALDYLYTGNVCFLGSNVGDLNPAETGF